MAKKYDTKKQSQKIANTDGKKTRFPTSTGGSNPFSMNNQEQNKPKDDPKPKPERTPKKP